MKIRACLKQRGRLSIKTRVLCKDSRPESWFISEEVVPFSGMAEQMRLLQQSYTNSIAGVINATTWDAHETLCVRYKSDRLSQMSVDDVRSFRKSIANGKKKYNRVVDSKFCQK